jgi:hypothetical protein
MDFMNLRKFSAWIVTEILQNFQPAMKLRIEYLRHKNQCHEQLERNLANLDILRALERHDNLAAKVARQRRDVSRNQGLAPAKAPVGMANSDKSRARRRDALTLVRVALSSPAFCVIIARQSQQAPASR